jgi:hypothetical protein
MAARRPLADSLGPLLDAQDQVVHRDQAMAGGHSRRSIQHRVSSGAWRCLLPDVYLTHRGEPVRRALLQAALLYAGTDSAVDGPDACRYYGIRAIAVDEEKIHVVVPWGSSVRSRPGLVVRRTLAPIRLSPGSRLRVVDPATAAIAASRRMTAFRPVLALLSDTVQRRVSSYRDLMRAHIEGPPKRSRFGDQALLALAPGVESLAEADFATLAEASIVLPRAIYNARLRLPTGHIVVVDALFESSGVVHEVNGRVAHARQDLFDAMQERHDALTAAGLVVLHNAPSRLRQHPRQVVAEVEQCHLRNDGRGLPPGVVLLPPLPPMAI